MLSILSIKTLMNFISDVFPPLKKTTFQKERRCWGCQRTNAQNSWSWRPTSNNVQRQQTATMATSNNNLTDDDNDDNDDNDNNKKKKKNALTNTGPWFYAMTFPSFPPHHLTFRVLLLHHYISSFSTSSFTSPGQTSKEEIW